MVEQELEMATTAREPRYEEAFDVMTISLSWAGANSRLVFST